MTMKHMCVFLFYSATVGHIKPSMTPARISFCCSPNLFQFMTNGNKLKAIEGSGFKDFLLSTMLSSLQLVQLQQAIDKTNSLSSSAHNDIKLINLFLPWTHGRKSEKKTFDINIKTINFRFSFKIGNWKISSWLPSCLDGPDYYCCFFSKGVFVIKCFPIELLLLESNI